MTNPVFTATTTPTLGPDAQRLVDIYDQTPGSSGPYCNPAGLAAALEALADLAEFGTDGRRLFRAYARMLRGCEP